MWGMCDLRAGGFGIATTGADATGGVGGGGACPACGCAVAERRVTASAPAASPVPRSALREIVIDDSEARYHRAMKWIGGGVVLAGHAAAAEDRHIDWFAGDLDLGGGGGTPATEGVFLGRVRG